MELLHTNALDKEVLNKEFADFNGRIAVKLHYGELGNKTRINPEHAKIVVQALQENGCEPFLFDSSVVYPSKRQNVKDHRETAAKQGFTEYDMGCELVFTDEIVPVKTEHMTAEVCKPLLDADGMVVLTHVKGHICTGMGGAIKNLGMGGLSPKTKGEIHSRAEAVYDDGCTECGLCVKICPFHSIELQEGRPVIGNCAGCDQCVDNCPAEALKVKDLPFDLMISEGAQAVMKDQRCYYINVIENVTKLCDCCEDPGEMMGPDAGILMGKDIVAIDWASIDLAIKASGEDIFKKHHHQSAYSHVKEAEKLGMGKREYTIKEI